MLKCIAIDDEPIALSIIERFCQKRGDIELEKFSSPRTGLKRILERVPDIVLLDIEMNGISGIELAKELPSTCALIFTTAFASYALEGFEVNAVDFLHKPYFYERFCRAIQKAEQWLKMRDLLSISESSERQLMLNSDYKKVAISIDTILYIESIDNYVQAHLSDGSTILSKISLKSVEEQLPENEFIRIHRSYLVARSRITGFNSREVELSRSGLTLPIGRKYTSDVIAILGKK